ncbi:MAG: single-stranded DNA-binding protein [Planctomycetes bacterium]|nr:single-stranded DNA-binding protein [Planctomycetota bacterium]
MANLNKVMLMGNLTRDPVVKYLPNGNAVCEIGLATNRVWFDPQTKEKKEAVTFVDCVAYARTGENIGKFFKKGKPIFIEGRLNYRAWEKDGVKRSKLEVVVEGFEFIGGRDGESGQNRSGDGGRSDAHQQQAAHMDEGAGSGGGGAAHYDDEVPF